MGAKFITSQTNREGANSQDEKPRHVTNSYAGKGAVRYAW
jgi:hypothetical protein